MRTWRAGLAVSVALHAGLAVWALVVPAPAPPAPSTSPPPVRLTFVQIESAPEAPPAVATREAVQPRVEPRSRRSPKKRAAPSAPSTKRAAGESIGEGAGTSPAGPPSRGAAPGGNARARGGAEDLMAIELGVAPTRAPTVDDAVLLPPSGPPPPPDPRFKDKGGGDVAYEHQSFTARIKHDGTVEFEDHLAGYTGLGAWFDVTDSLMAAVGDDAYKAHKLALLDATREKRLEMAAEACEERLDQTLYGLKADLETLWADPKPSTDAKKRMIFQLWDDCAETGPANIVHHGAMARATVVAFVRRHLPQGSALAFTVDELVALNERRQSKARFDPYETVRTTDD